MVHQCRNSYRRDCNVCANQLHNVSVLAICAAPPSNSYIEEDLSECIMIKIVLELWVCTCVIYILYGQMFYHTFNIVWTYILIWTHRLHSYAAGSLLPASFNVTHPPPGSSQLFSAYRYVLKRWEWPAWRWVATPFQHTHLFFRLSVLLWWMIPCGKIPNGKFQ